MKKREVRRRKKAPQNNRGPGRPGGWAARQQAKRVGRGAKKRGAGRTVGFVQR